MLIKTFHKNFSNEFDLIELFVEVLLLDGKLINNIEVTVLPFRDLL